MIRKATLTMGGLAVLLLAVQALHAELIRPDERGVASGAYSDADTVWYINGINGNWLAVGQPNMWNRRDRVVFRFPILKFLPGNSIHKAILRFDYNSAGEVKRVHKIEVEHFTEERVYLAGRDLLTRATTSVHVFEVPPDCPNTQMEIDVTKEVQADLRLGFEFTAFRVRSITSDEIGNPEMKSSFVNIGQGSMRLSVMP